MADQWNKDPDESVRDTREHDEFRGRAEKGEDEFDEVTEDIDDEGVEEQIEDDDSDTTF
jgi:hypothetical protein